MFINTKLLILLLYFSLMLDHCMTIKNKEQFQDARKKRRQQLKLERSMKKSYEKSLEKPPDVFTFLNNKLSKWTLCET